MSMQNLYDSYFIKLLDLGTIEVKCAELHIPKLRTGLHRAQISHKEFIEKFGEEVYEMKKIMIAYNHLTRIAKVTLASFKDSKVTGFELL